MARFQLFALLVVACAAGACGRQLKSEGSTYSSEGAYVDSYNPPVYEYHFEELPTNYYLPYEGALMNDVEYGTNVADGYYSEAVADQYIHQEAYAKDSEYVYQIGTVGQEMGQVAEVYSGASAYQHAGQDFDAEYADNTYQVGTSYQALGNLAEYGSGADAYQTTHQDMDAEYVSDTYQVSSAFQGAFNGAEYGAYANLNQNTDTDFDAEYGSNIYQIGYTDQFATNLGVDGVAYGTQDIDVEAIAEYTDNAYQIVNAKQILHNGAYDGGYASTHQNIDVDTSIYGGEDVYQVMKGTQIAGK